MKFKVHIKKKHARELLKQIAVERDLTLLDVYVMALDIGMAALTAHHLGQAPKA